MMMMARMLAVSQVAVVLGAPVNPSFIQTTGNACATGENGVGVPAPTNAHSYTRCRSEQGSPCGCGQGGCKDHPGFKYKGTMENATACEATCTGAAGGCDIWLWSEGSKHCWWRTDKYWAPTPGGGVISGCLETGADCVPGCGKCAAKRPAPPAPPPFVPKWAKDEDNMNGDYPLSLTPKGQDAATKFPKRYQDFPKGEDIEGIEYFDMYSPLFSQLYSQVWWTGLAPTPFPKDVIERYAGRGMVIAGFEMDQVKRAKGCECPQGGACNENKTECATKDIPVPLTCAYNHHFESGIAGGKARFEKVKFTGEDDPRLLKLLEERAATGMGGHGIPSHEEHWMVIEDEEEVAAGGLPTKTAIGAGNGGEYRKSFHGYAPGYGQVIGSPHTLQLTPMQIDTWNRDHMKCDGSGEPFVPGPLPRNSWAPPGATYSGLLECPVTTRITKVYESDVKLQAAGSCQNKTETATECFHNAKAALGQPAATAKTATVSDPSKPAGCSASLVGKDIEIYFNTANSEQACGPTKGAVGGSFSSVTSTEVHIDSEKDIVTITATGPAADWFGIGFGAQAMKQAPWAIIMEGDGKVTERKLADQSPGTLLPSTVKVVSNTVADGKRTVVMTRSVKGQTSQYFTFDSKVTSIPMINAVGSGPKLAYHKLKDPVTLSLLPTDGGAACVCEGAEAPFGSKKGKLLYTPTNQTGERGTAGSVSFDNSCAPAPRTVMLEQKNPTCDIRTYVGGQTACHHMWSLLDADQEIPWPDQPLEYHLKVRFWVQPYEPKYHTPVSHHATWGIASPVEYDVPKCNATIPGCSPVPGSHNPNGAEGKEWIHTIEGVYAGAGNLSAAHFHCHAPTCISMKMMFNDTGEVICEERPIYGGTGKLDIKRFDETGYILQPPCIWGKEEHGLEPPIDVSGRMLRTVKTANATAGHHGEMAWQQMFMVDKPF